MPYRLVKGHFELHYKITRHVGSRPDGDSAWFKADNPKNLKKLGGRTVKFNKGGFAQMRFEGIDALELHYNGSNHQRIPECVNARDYLLLQQIGFTDVTYAPSGNIDMSVRTATPERIKGYILTRNADIYGRPVAIVFEGETPKTDGDEYFLDVNWIKQGFNANLIASGHAYPSYYSTFPWDLRAALTVLYHTARNKKLGTIKKDDSLSGAQVRKKDDLAKYAIWPKLYRRVFKYFAAGKTGLAGFDKWIRAKSNRDDELWIISRAEKGNMHDIYEIKNNKIKMAIGPEDIVIVPK